MSKTLVSAMLTLLLFVGNGMAQVVAELAEKNATPETGTLEKLIASSGGVTIRLDSGKFSGGRQKGMQTVQFSTEPDSFFTVLVFNDELRGPLPGMMKMVPQSKAALSPRLDASLGQLMLENNAWNGPYELSVRDSVSGFTFFNVEGHIYDYTAADRRMTVTGGRILLSKEYAAELGRPGDENAIVGEIDMNIVMRPIEVTTVVNGEVTADKIPALNSDFAGTVPGPDVVVGDLTALGQFGSSFGSQVGLAIGTDSCNFGTVDLNWFANPSNDHPVIPQNLYRMSGGTDNTERFEQIGQSQMKHGFTALTQNLCALGCNGVGGSRLGSGCSDPYSSGLNAGPNLGSRAWVNPFTGFFPRNDSATPNNNHTGHVHNGPTHRILTEISDLSTTLNPGATYWGEAQYVTPHEFAWCQANPTQCNMYNNVSHRRFTVSGTTSPFTFSAAAPTVRTKPAVNAWTGATLQDLQPAPGVDGVFTVAYKITNPSPGVWHYEYAIYNQNLDRAIQSFSLPLGNGVTLSNIGFRAPAQHPGSTGDGTLANAGFSSTPWTPTQTASSMTWNSDTLAQNPNANAIRWGTMYNFRFDSNRPPTAGSATIGYFKTGSPTTVAVQVPSAATSQVSVTGRIAMQGGNARSLSVTLTAPSGATQTVRAGSFGQFTFPSVTTGGTYLLTARGRGFSFPTIQVPVSDNVVGLTLVGTEN